MKFLLVRPGILTVALFLSLTVAASGGEFISSRGDGPSANFLGGSRPTLGMEDRIAYLRSEIGIGDEQVSAWNDYQNALEDYRIEVQRKRQLELDRLLNGERTPASSFQTSDDLRQAKVALRSAYLRFYVLLSQEQQLLADRVLTRAECGL
jgi:hypothetical protein